MNFALDFVKISFINAVFYHTYTKKNPPLLKGGGFFVFIKNLLILFIVFLSVQNCVKNVYFLLVYMNMCKQMIQAVFMVAAAF